MNTDPSYYDWVPFFHDICHEIIKLSAEPDRDYLLFLKAKDTFESSDPILKIAYVDPFSYIYALAQKNTKNQFERYFLNAKAAFQIEKEIPSDYIFPTPQPNSLSLFYDKGSYINSNGQEVGSSCIWDLFNSVFKNEIISEQDFISVLSLKNVGVVKLTQVIFLVNPEHYIPLDSRMNSLPIPELADLSNSIKQIANEGYPAYKSIVGKVASAFPGCKMYEVNLLNWLINSSYSEHLKVTHKYFQVSSNAYGQNNQDYFDNFTTNNCVWTGGPAGMTGKQKYPLEEANAGDVILVRRGTVRLGGIGIILENGYKANGWNENVVIKILWLVKETRSIPKNRIGQWIGFDHATEKTLNLFWDVYPDTFQVLDLIRQKQRTMINHSLNQQKNIILAGPPGTGKTRKALQIARWLTRGMDHSVSLIKAIEQNMINEKPDIEDIPEAEIIQFHPSYSYEDFVRGVSTEAVDGKIVYKVENKTLARIAETASKPENINKAYVLVIDEINRANLSTVLGELIYALEYRGKVVKTLYKYDKSCDLSIPDNLYIIGTMNTADRSVGHIDYAIRRRFLFIPVPPDSNVITHTNGQQLFKAVDEILREYLSPEFNFDDVRVGHSYFLKDGDELYSSLQFGIRPILLEYLKDGVLLEGARQPIIDLHV